MPALQNPKHELFAQELAKGRTADEAYSEAGYKANRGNAANLKANETIQGRVVELLDRSAAKTGVTIDRLVEALADIGFDKDAKTSDRISALEKLGKHLGMFREKVEVTGKDGGPLEMTEISHAQRKAALALILARQ